MLALTQLWRPVGLALLIVAALAYRALLVRQRDAARAQATHLQVELTEAQAANTAMHQAIVTQNAAVAQLEAKLKQSADEAAARERSAAAQGTAAMRMAAASASALEKARMGAGCEAAIRWGNAQSAELARW